MKKVLHLAFAVAMLMIGQSAMAQNVTTVFDESFDLFTDGSEESPATTDISTGFGAICPFLEDFLLFFGG